MILDFGMIKIVIIMHAHDSWLQKNHSILAKKQGLIKIMENMANAQLNSDEVSNNKIREVGIISYQISSILIERKERKGDSPYFWSVQNAKGQKLQHPSSCPSCTHLNR